MYHTSWCGCAVGHHGEEQAPAPQAALLVACEGAELRSLGICTSMHHWLAGVALSALLSVDLILNDLELNCKGRSLVAVAWLKRSDSQEHSFGICR